MLPVCGIRRLLDSTPRSKFSGFMIHLSAAYQYSRYLCIPLVVFLSVSTVMGQVVINEISAANWEVFADNFGDYEDWVELYNAGTSVEDVSGWHLSDRADEPTKWEFPAGSTIPAGGHLRIWCSKRDGAWPGHLHSNFKISQTRGVEGVYLNDAAGLHVDSNGLDFPNQATHSWGRSTDGASDWKLFINPTPNASNNTSINFDGYVPTPVMYPDAGAFTGATPVTITCADPAATIYYTTNGDEPGAGSTVYTSPINVSSTQVIRAIAINAGSSSRPSFMETNTYLVGAPHTIKVLSIAGSQVDNLLGGSWLKPIGSFELFDESGNLLAEAVGDFNEHGNDSWAYPQRGLDYITRDQFGYDYAVRTKIFRNKERKKFQRLILKAAANDNYPYENGAHIRDSYVHAISQWADLRVDERTFEPCVMYVNGQYWGVYDIREKVDDPDFTDYYYNQDEEDIDFLKTWGGTWEEYGSRADWDALFAYIMANDMTIPANYDYVDERYNMGSLIDYTVLHSWNVCADWLNWNTAWWRGRVPEPIGDKQKWRYALWDDDATFGHYINYTGMPSTGPTADPCDPASLGGWSDPEGHMAILNKLFTNEDFNDDYINRYADLINYYFHCDYSIPFLDSLIGMIEPEMPDQIARWGGTLAGWNNAVNDLRQFINDRCAYIVGGIEDCYGIDAYPVTLIIEPPGAGEIDINTIEPPAFPWEATYFSGIDIDLDADATTGWVFDYWETFNNPVADTYDEETTIELAGMGDTIIAHFRETVLPTYPIHIIVNPPGAGTVTINAIDPGLFPWDGAFISGTMIEVEANPSTGYNFDYWDLYQQFINPSPTDANAFFAISSGDTLEANFRLGTALDEINPVNELDVFPNVTDDHVYVVYDLDETASTIVELYAPTGVLIDQLQPQMTIAPGKHAFEVDLTQYGLADGVYMVAIRANGVLTTQKIIFSD